MRGLRVLVLNNNLILTALTTTRTIFLEPVNLQ